MNKNEADPKRKNRIPKKPGSTNYIDNKVFYEAMKVYHTEHTTWKALPEDTRSVTPKPRVPEYVGQCILLIAERLCYRPNFINYTYKEEMISDGIENCLQYIDNFNPNVSTNPFAYFTQIVYYAFLRRIGKEKKQQYIKYAAMKQMDNRGTFEEWARREGIDGDGGDVYAAYMRLTANDIAQFESKPEQHETKPKKAKKAPTTKATLGSLIPEDPTE